MVFGACCPSIWLHLVWCRCDGGFSHTCRISCFLQSYFNRGTIRADNRGLENLLLEALLIQLPDPVTVPFTCIGVKRHHGGIGDANTSTFSWYQASSGRPVHGGVIINYTYLFCAFATQMRRPAHPLRRDRKTNVTRKSFSRLHQQTSVWIVQGIILCQHVKRQYLPFLRQIRFSPGRIGPALALHSLSPCVEAHSQWFSWNWTAVSSERVRRTLLVQKCIQRWCLENSSVLQFNSSLPPLCLWLFHSAHTVSVVLPLFRLCCVCFPPRYFPCFFSCLLLCLRSLPAHTPSPCIRPERTSTTMVPSVCERRMLGQWASLQTMALQGTRRCDTDSGLLGPSPPPWPNRLTLGTTSVAVWPDHGDGGFIRREVTRWLVGSHQMFHVQV